MKNIQVIEAYINGDKTAKTAHLHIDGQFLYNYNTPLAQRVNNGDGRYFYVLNATKYSRTTSTIQNKLRDMIPEGRILRIVSDIPMGANYLI